MMDSLIQKLEEKVMILVTELDDLRKELIYVKNENSFLRAEKQDNREKLEGLIALLDAAEVVQEPDFIADRTMEEVM